MIFTFDARLGFISVMASCKPCGKWRGSWLRASHYTKSCRRMMNHGLSLNVHGLMKVVTKVGEARLRRIMHGLLQAVTLQIWSWLAIWDSRLMSSRDIDV